MDAATFLRTLGPAAAAASAATGFPEPVVLAQWANETGWGTSSAFLSGHNFAGVSPGGSVASYPDLATGLAAYEATANAHYYDPVRAAPSPEAAAVALGAGPWAAGHYQDANNEGPGSALLQIMAGAEGDTAAATLLGSGTLPAIAASAGASTGGASTGSTTAPAPSNPATSILSKVLGAVGVPTAPDIARIVLTGVAVVLGVGLVGIGAFRATDKGGGAVPALAGALA